MQELVKAADLAKSLKVSTASISAWASKGTIPAVRINSRVVRFDPVAVAKALGILQPSPTQPPAAA